jgi:hemolysin activation/secretion protein
MIAGLAQAQVPPDAGSILRDQQKPAFELPTRPAPSIKRDEPARPAAQPSAARFVLKSIRIGGNTAFAQMDLLAVVQDCIGKEAGFVDLNEAAARISRYYRERGYLVARAYLPAQDIKDGVVEIAVIEGRFGKVELNNKSRVRDGVARSHTDALSGATVHEANLLRLQSLSERASLYLSFAGQKAGKNRDSSEKFVLGGAQSVRAYPQGEAAGDSGYVATAELRYTVPVAALPGILQPFVFVDAGGVTLNEHPFIAGANSRHLSGAGFGVSWAKANDFQVKLTLATRVVSQSSVSSDTDRHTRGWVQVTQYF